MAKHKAGWLLAVAYLSDLFFYISYMDKYTAFVLHSETSVSLIVTSCFTSGRIKKNLRRIEVTQVPTHTGRNVSSHTEGRPKTVL